MTVVELDERRGSQGRRLAAPHFVERGGPLGGELEDGAFTVEHFERWAYGLVLDTWEPWRVEPFQAAFVEDLFAGAPVCWLVVPEGNGKTTALAGLALYHCQFLPQAFVPVAASSREQAAIVYRQAEGFVYRSPAIRELFKPLEGRHRIRCDGMGSRIQVMAADDRTGDGIIGTLHILEELHRHRDLRLYRTWLGKLAKRGGQAAVISTAGEPGSEFEAVRELMRQDAAEVERDGSFVRARSAGSVLHEFAVPEDGDVDDMRVVKAANPFSGITPESLAAKRALPGMTEQHWRRFTCNLPTRSVRAAVTEREWHAAGVDERIPVGASVSAGLDVGWKLDTTSLVPLWWRDDEFRLLGRATILEPPAEGLHPDAVKRAVVEMAERFTLERLVMDTHRAEDIAAWAADELPDTAVVDRAQSLSFQVRDFEAFMTALRNGWLRHERDPGLTRHVLNAIARVLPKGETVFARPAEARTSGEQPRRVIDALVAAGMVHSTVAIQTVPGEAFAEVW